MNRAEKTSVPDLLSGLDSGAASNHFGDTQQAIADLKVAILRGDADMCEELDSAGFIKKLLNAYAVFRSEEILHVQIVELVTIYLRMTKSSTPARLQAYTDAFMFFDPIITTLDSMSITSNDATDTLHQYAEALDSMFTGCGKANIATILEKPELNQRIMNLISLVVQIPSGPASFNLLLLAFRILRQARSKAPKAIEAFDQLSMIQSDEILAIGKQTDNRAYVASILETARAKYRNSCPTRDPEALKALPHLNLRADIGGVFVIKATHIYHGPSADDMMCTGVISAVELSLLGVSCLVFKPDPAGPGQPPIDIATLSGTPSQLQSAMDGELVLEQANFSPSPLPIISIDIDIPGKKLTWSQRNYEGKLLFFTVVLASVEAAIEAESVVGRLRTGTEKVQVRKAMQGAGKGKGGKVSAGPVETNPMSTPPSNAAALARNALVNASTAALTKLKAGFASHVKQMRANMDEEERLQLSQAQSAADHTISIIKGKKPSKVSQWPHYLSIPASQGQAQASLPQIGDVFEYGAAEEKARANNVAAGKRRSKPAAPQPSALPASATKPAAQAQVKEKKQDQAVPMKVEEPAVRTRHPRTAATKVSYAEANLSQAEEIEDEDEDMEGCGAKGQEGRGRSRDAGKSADLHANQPDERARQMSVPPAAHAPASMRTGGGVLSGVLGSKGGPAGPLSRPASAPPSKSKQAAVPTPAQPPFSPSLHRPVREKPSAPTDSFDFTGDDDEQDTHESVHGRKGGAAKGGKPAGKPTVLAPVPPAARKAQAGVGPVGSGRAILQVPAEPLIVRSLIAQTSVDAFALPDDLDDGQEQGKGTSQPTKSSAPALLLLLKTPAVTMRAAQAVPGGSGGSGVKAVPVPPKMPKGGQPGALPKPKAYTLSQHADQSEKGLSIGDMRARTVAKEAASHAFAAQEVTPIQGQDEDMYGRDGDDDDDGVSTGARRAASNRGRSDAAPSTMRHARPTSLAARLEEAGRVGAYEEQEGAAVPRKGKPHTAGAGRDASFSRRFSFSPDPTTPEDDSMGMGTSESGTQDTQGMGSQTGSGSVQADAEAAIASLMEAVNSVMGGAERSIASAKSRRLVGLEQEMASAGGVSKSRLDKLEKASHDLLRAMKAHAAAQKEAIAAAELFVRQAREGASNVRALAGEVEVAIDESMGAYHATLAAEEKLVTKALNERAGKTMQAFISAKARAVSAQTGKAVVGKAKANLMHLLE